jgi:hypothetical protein
MMKYNVGDKVRFLNEVGGGTISAIIGAGKVNVTDEDGFEIPVRVTDIVVVGRDDYGETDGGGKDKLPSPKNISVSPTTERNTEYPAIVDSDDYELSLAFIPCDRSNPLDCSLDLHFVNDSSFYCKYLVAYRVGADKLRLMGNGDLAPETQEYVCRIDRVEFVSKLNLHIVCLLYKHREYKYYPPEQISLDLSPLKFTRKNVFTENDFFDEKACIMKIATNRITESTIDLDPRDLEAAMKQKKDAAQPVKPLQKPKPAIEEVDLHIGELVEDMRGLDNAQMLEIQKARFIAAMESGFASKTEKIVFIHGVGNGRLKYEIRRLLDTQYAGLARYYDASFQEYGFGATMVILGR